MSIEHRLHLFIDGELPGGSNAVLDAKTSNPPNVTPRWMQGDRATLKIFFRKRGAAGAASTPLELASGFTLVVSGKNETALASDTELFRSDSFTLDGSSDDAGYSSTLDLNTPAILEAFTGSEKEITMAVDIEYRDALNTVRLTYRAKIMLVRQSFAGADPVAYPVASAGGYSWQLSVSDAGQLQITRLASAVIGAPAAYRFTSPGGYVYELTVTDDGQHSIERV